MGDRLRFLLNRIGERLWVKPLAMCVLSIAAAFVAQMADDTKLGLIVPEISSDSVETLLRILSASMLVIATFAVASMVSAYASASTTATPRTFSLVIADDVSQNALSTFVGAFIFSIVALIALKNGYYGKAGHFALFMLTLSVFAAVLLTFVRWVDRIARLGRLGATIERVELATANALKRRRRTPHLRGVPAGPQRSSNRSVSGNAIGYVQRVDVAALQKVAEATQLRITVASLPGAFLAPGDALVCVSSDGGDVSELDPDAIAKAFVIANDRLFDEDPRFGLIVLSQIASRALSPAVNDPGTAIDIIGSLVRLFALWSAPLADGEASAPEYDRVEVPALCVRDLFDDAFTAIARDGAGCIEVAGRLQRALESLTRIGDAEMHTAAKEHARVALARAEHALAIPDDLQLVRELAAFAEKD